MATDEDNSETLHFTFGTDDVGAAIEDVDVVSEMGEPEPFAFDGDGMSAFVGSTKEQSVFSYRATASPGTSWIRQI